MKLTKVFCLLLLVLGCEPISNNNQSNNNQPVFLPNYLPKDWKTIGNINGSFFYVKDTKRDLCFVWEDLRYISTSNSGNGPTAYVPCEKLEKIENGKN